MPVGDGKHLIWDNASLKGDGVNVQGSIEGDRLEL